MAGWSSLFVQVFLFLELCFCINVFAADNSQKNLKISQAQIINYGIYKLVENQASEKNEAQAENRLAESDVLKMLHYVKKTNEIPAQLGVRFGVSFTVSGLKDKKELTLRRVLKHPPMQSGDGQMTTGRTYVEKFDVIHGIAVGATGFGFDSEEEMVFGNWTFEYWNGNQKILTKTFRVYDPEI